MWLEDPPGGGPQVGEQGARTAASPLGRAMLGSHHTPSLGPRWGTWVQKQEVGRSLHPAWLAQ